MGGGGTDIRSRLAAYDPPFQGREFSSRFLDGEGSYRTGDLGHFDQNGYLVLTGRIKELVIRGGEKIPAGEIEGLLRTCPGVSGAVIVGVPHPRLGEALRRRSGTGRRG